MSTRVSIKDVAVRAGVSWKTVSNVVNERPVVRAETRQRVLTAIQELGYVPNHAGRELRGGPTRSIALGVPELQNPYFARLAERMQAAARERDHTISVVVSLGSADSERALLRGQTPRPVDAVIISPSVLSPAELTGRRDGQRVVLLGEALPGSGDIAHVAIDNVASAVDVVQHLVAGGRQRLLFLGADGKLRSTGTDRLSGFRAATRFAGLPQDGRLVRPVPGWTREAGRDGILAALGDGVDFDAVVAGNDLLALGALAALHSRGRRVPEDVAVVGWDDVPEAAWSRPSLTTVAPDLEALIAAALDAALTPPEGHRDRETVIAHRLIERESSSPSFPR